MRYFLLLSLLFALLFANNNTLLLKKGARIAKILCQKEIESLQAKDLKEAKQNIQSQHLCPKLNDKQLLAVATYVVDKPKTTTSFSQIDVPPKAKCPICGMFVAKYPKWVALMQDKSGQKLYFDGVKDMMKYYFNHPKEKFQPILVSDFYTLMPIDAKEAYFVIGSNVYGPMGEELIPFKTKEDAKTFLNEHAGKKIVRFDEIEEAYLY